MRGAGCEGALVKGRGNCDPLEGTVIRGWRICADGGGFCRYEACRPAGMLSRLVVLAVTLILLAPGGVAHVPAGVVHGYRNVTDAHFLTIVTQGNASVFFAEVARKVEMSPPDIPGVVRVAAGHDISFAQ